MPRLLDLLQYLAQPGQEELWLLLDIKVRKPVANNRRALTKTLQLDNNPDDVMRLIGETIRQVRSIKNRPWNQRVVLGIWAVSLPYFLQLPC